MPNWVYNDVTIAAPIEEVKAFLFLDESNKDRWGIPATVFDMHELYPENFAADDRSGDEAWDYDWMVDNTGAKWNPRVEAGRIGKRFTGLRYRTAWEPNIYLLKHLSEKTGWDLQNRYEEEDSFRGVFEIKDGRGYDDRKPRLPRCRHCGGDVEEEFHLLQTRLCSYCFEPIEKGE